MELSQGFPELSSQLSFPFILTVPSSKPVEAKLKQRFSKKLQQNPSKELKLQSMLFDLEVNIHKTTNLEDLKSEVSYTNECAQQLLALEYTSAEIIKDNVNLEATLPNKRFFILDQTLTSQKITNVLDKYTKPKLDSLFLIKGKSTAALPTESQLIGALKSYFDENFEVLVQTNNSSEQRLDMKLHDILDIYEGRVLGPKGLGPLNMTSLQVEGTPIENFVKLPEWITQVDWLQCEWLQMRLKPNRTKVSKYIMFSQMGSFSDWSMDSYGLATWFAVTTGKMLLFAIPAGPKTSNVGFNLKSGTQKYVDVYLNWSATSTEVDETPRKHFFSEIPQLMGDNCDAQIPKSEIIKLVINPGDVAILPGGFCYSFIAEENCITFSGSFLCTANLENQIKVREAHSLMKNKDAELPQFLQIHSEIILKNVEYLAKNKKPSTKITLGTNQLKELSLKVSNLAKQSSNPKYSPLVLSLLSSAESILAKQDRKKEGEFFRKQRKMLARCGE